MSACVTFLVIFFSFSAPRVISGVGVGEEGGEGEERERERKKERERMRERKKEIYPTDLSDEDGALLFPSCANFSRSFQKLKLIDCKV